MTPRDELAAQLAAGHRRTREAFGQFHELWEAGETDRCDALARRCCALLAVYAAPAEELFYPALRGCADVALAERRLVQEAEIEQLVIRILVSQLRRMGPADEQFAALVSVLSRYAELHAHQVEEMLLPRLPPEARLDWRGLSSAMRGRRDTLERQWQAELREESLEAERQQDA